MIHPAARQRAGSWAWWCEQQVVKAMTSTRETQAISEALALIDRGLGDMQRRSLVSGDEVANLLLDVRLLLMLSEEAEPQLN